MASKDSKEITESVNDTGIRAVARRARVSPATVSRVVNGQATVTGKLAKRVRDAIRELGYMPNPQARALGSGRSRVLGLIISEITNPFYPELVQSFETLAENNDFEVMLGSVIHNDEHAKRFVRRLIQRRVEGVAVMTFRAETDYLNELIVHHIPLVTIDASVGVAKSLALEVDYRCGINQAIQHLALLGHRCIGFISGPMQHLTNKLRHDAFLESVQKIGLRPDDTPIFEGDHTFEAGAAAVAHFLGLKDRPTAIVSSNDLMAVGALRVLSEQKMNVPAEMSVIGFDDIHLAEFAHPPLSTVRMSRADLAVAAFEGLMRLTQDSLPSQPGPICVTTQLVVRQSTGPHINAMNSPASDGLEIGGTAPLREIE
jgi:LacI family transcriptional regulator